MKKYTIPNTDLVVSRISYGYAYLVDWAPGPPGESTILALEKLIHAAHANGITLFDLADQYSFGKAEAAFGEVLRRSPGLRHKIVLQSKCGNIYKGQFDVAQLNSSRAYIVQTVEGSLQSLGTDHLDILLLHYPDLLARPEEIAAAFDDLNRSGKVRYFGVSNHNPSRIELLRRFVQQPLVINQISVNLAECRQLVGGTGLLWGAVKNIHDYTELPATVDYCRLHDIQVEAYAPIRNRILSAAEGESEEMDQAKQLLAKLANEKGTNPSAVILAWLLHHPAHFIPIIGASNPAHLVENCAADKVHLTREEWYRLLRANLRLG